ncbi:MAG TPA: hypothetical protein VFD53_06815, partial [Ilumatobacter sp.]|nr:hypothetical protein [Ilumatobacter sp.]
LWFDVEGYNTIDHFHGDDVADGFALNFTAGGDIDVVISDSAILESHTHLPEGAAVEFPRFDSTGIYNVTRASSAGGAVSVWAQDGELLLGAIMQFRGAHATTSTITGQHPANVGANGEVSAANGDVSLRAAGSIQQSNPGVPALLGRDIALASDGGGIGSPGNPLEIDSGPSGVVTASALHDIYLVEVAGDLHLAQAASAAGSVALAAAGGITGHDVSGTGVSLMAGAGIDLEIASGGGLVDALAVADIELREVMGNLLVGRVASALGDVRLEAAVSILDGQADADDDIEAADIRLIAGGSIGSAGNDIEIVSDGRVTALSATGIFLAETDGDLLLDLASTAGAVHLAAAAAIRDDDSEVDVVGSNAVLRAGSGIGAPDNPLETEIDALEAHAGAGDVWLVNSGALDIGDVTAAGDVNIVALSPITVSGDLACASVYLEAADSPGDGDDITVLASGSITATAGNVTLVAADDLVVETGSAITALAGQVSLSAGGDLEVSGTILADALLIEGSDADNLFTITAVDTDTTLRTFGGNDTVRVGGGTVDAIDALLSVDGGNDAGHDRLVVDETTDAGTNSGKLTATDVTGLGMSGSVHYAGFEEIEVSLGTGADDFTVESVGTAAALNAGEGADTINVGAGSVNAIAALLSVDGQGGSDALNIDDSDDLERNVGTLTVGTLIGLGMGGSVAYATMEELNIDLGSGADIFTVISTHTGSTTVNGNGGDDTVNVLSISGDTSVKAGEGDDTINAGAGSVNAIDALL